MNTDQLNAIRRLRRVQEFLTAHPFGDESASLGKQRSELDAVVTQLSQGTFDQESGQRQTTAVSRNQHVLRRALWYGSMLPVARVARDVLGVTGLDAALKMPRASVAFERVVTAAESMAEAATPHEAEFVEHGLPPNFIAVLRSRASKLAESLVVRDGAQRRGTTATSTLKLLLKRGRRAVRLLNAILEAQFEEQPELKEAWENARRFKPAVSVMSAESPAPTASLPGTPTATSAQPAVSDKAA